MYRLCSKLVCLSKPMKVTDDNKSASLLNNRPIFCTLQIHNALPGANVI